MNTLFLINSIIALARQSLPLLEELRNRGDITPEEQEKVKAEWDKFVSEGDNMFDQPHWKPSDEQ